MEFLKRLSSLRKERKQVDLSKLHPELLKEARAQLQEKRAEEVTYDVEQSTLKEYTNKWLDNSLTNRDHERLKKLVRRLVKKTLQEKPFDRVLGKLAKGMYLMDHTARLMSLLSWQILHEELEVFKNSYRGSRDGEVETPEYRLVWKRLEAQVCGLNPETASMSSVDAYNVLRHYNGQPFGFWSGDDPYDVVHQYAHMIVRVMWRLYTGRHVDVQWLRNPGIVETVDAQVCLLYYALLYTQTEAKERLKLVSRHMEDR